jgi:hypothetical protein
MSSHYVKLCAIRCVITGESVLPPFPRPNLVRKGVWEDNRKCMGCAVERKPAREVAAEVEYVLASARP